jgi:hypothetical protein
LETPAKEMKAANFKICQTEKNAESKEHLPMFQPVPTSQTPSILGSREHGIGSPDYTQKGGGEFLEQQLASAYQNDCGPCS